MSEILKKRKVFKYNQDDILEILMEYLAEENGFNTFQSKAMLAGNVDEGIRLIAVIGDLEDDDICKLDLDKVDKENDFNGTHSNLDENFYFKDNKKQ
ncbi:hypothetical protein [Peribacillus sp. Hz7]|uniref:hypothetical protein n=1 Tax=Peribacillus sp. Hz7 TaxID=3344873 RepID=UPI0035CC18E7